MLPMAQMFQAAASRIPTAACWLRYDTAHDMNPTGPYRNYDTIIPKVLVQNVMKDIISSSSTGIY